MGFKMASECKSIRQIRGSFPTADITVRAYRPKDGKPLMDVQLSEALCKRAGFHIGDRLDLGIDGSSNSMRLEVSDRGTLQLHIRNKSRIESKRRICCTLREEWTVPSDITEIPLMPCTHIIPSHGAVICRLPDSWQRFWRKS